MGIMPSDSLVIISHSYFFRQAYGKINEIGRHFKSVIVIQPHANTSIGKRYKLASSRLKLSPSVVILSIYSLFVESPTFYMYMNPVRFFWILMRESPKFILLEEDPHSIAGLLTLVALMVLRASGKTTYLVLFSWDNINRQPSFWLSRYLKEIATQLTANICSGLIAGNAAALHIAKTQKNYCFPSVILPLIGLPPAIPVANSRNLLKPFVIGYIGRVIHSKGLTTLFDACAKVSSLIPIRLVIVGGGQDLSFFKDYFQPTPDWLSFTGPLSFEDVYKQFSSIHLLVLPSIDTPTWKEQFGLVLAQAMSAGIPVIGSDSGAIPDVIGDYSLIFKQGDFDRLAVLIHNIATSPRLYQQLSVNAKKRYSSCFSSESVGLNYVRFLRSVETGCAICQINAYDQISSASGS
jgi:glycosyltransferase involved in cell wall biosynthesis